MNRPLASIILVLLLVLTLALSPASALAARPGSGAAVSVPVTGSLTDALGGLGTFAGTFTVQRFTLVNGQLAAVGTLTGTLTNSLGQIIGTVTQSVTIPITSVSGTCDVLHLTLGPLDLNLLGLTVHLDQVVLDISAQAGAGNLLGNLLCAVAHLLDTGGPLTGLVNLLNNLLRAL